MLARAPDGLNTFLSVANVEADCWTATNAQFTEDGEKVKKTYGMTILPGQLFVQRCADWKRAKPDIIFLEKGGLTGASAMKIGLGWFIQMGLTEDLGKIADPKKGQRILGNLALAFSQYV